jgi:hypothetical protein
MQNKQCHGERSSFADVRSLLAHPMPLDRILPKLSAITHLHYTASASASQAAKWLLTRALPTFAVS